MTKEHSRKKERRLVPAAALILAVLAIFAGAYAPSAVSAAATDRELPVYCVQRDGKYCSLTFDAAWGNEDTQRLIDILGAYNVRATFFVVGQWAEKYPESVRALHEAGHEVMNHSDTHPHMSALGSAEIGAELRKCSDKVKSITGVGTTLFRCPYGEYDDHVIRAVSAEGMTAVQWDVDSLDWKDYDAATITRRVMSRVQPGSIVLFHNAALHTPEALPGIIEQLLSQGYSIIPVSELLLQGDCFIDHTGRQCPAE